MNDETFMKLAIKEAKKFLEPLPCGAVVVKNGKVIAKAFNSQREDKSVLAHAEAKAIGKAGKVLGSKNLDDCTIYATCEPCSMCMAALNHAKVKGLVFGISLKDIPSDSSHKIDIKRNFLEAECKDLLNSPLK